MIRALLSLLRLPQTLQSIHDSQSNLSVAMHPACQCDTTAHSSVSRLNYQSQIMSVSVLCPPCKSETLLTCDQLQWAATGEAFSQPLVPELQY